MNESCTIQTANILVNALFESFFSHFFHPFPFFFVDFILFTHRFFSLQQNFVLLHMHTLVMCSINIICRYTIELFFPRTEWIKENEPREHYCCFMDARAIGMVTLKKNNAYHSLLQLTLSVIECSVISKMEKNITTDFVGGTARIVCLFCQHMIQSPKKHSTYFLCVHGHWTVLWSNRVSE